MNTLCAICQRPLPVGHAGGNCPACLFGAALSDEPLELSPAGSPAEDPTVLGEHVMQSPDGLATEVPTELGDYELLGEVGRGGTSVVYRARQRRLNRLVALKTLHGSALTSRDAFERLQIEAQAVARLDHPNIVPLYEVGRHAGTHFLTLRYFEHGSLAQALKQRRFTPTEAARFLATAARAVHHAHSRGVLHRDLKPSNFLLDEHGAPHVADFGLAKLADSDSSLTLSTSVLGTPAYMAPEQAAGHAKDAGTPADIYALGAVFFELLTGRPPFLGKSALEVLRLVADAEPPRPTALVPGLDCDLEAVCLRCLEKDPARRYASAAALAEDLERWLRQEPLSIRPLSVRERAVKWVRRRPLVALLSAACALAVLTGFAGILWQWRRAEMERARAEEAVLWQVIPAPSALEYVGVEIVDVNHDGRPDLLVALTEDGAAAVYLGQARGEFTLAPGSPFRAPNSRLGPDHDGALAVSDFDEDGELDIMLVNETTSSLSLLRGDGSGRFTPDEVPIKVGRQPRQLVTGDLNGDRHSDLVVANFGDASVTVLLGDGKGRFRAADGSPVPAGPAPWGLALADFNNDRLPDLAVSNSGTNTVSVYLNQGGGQLGEVPGSPYPVGKGSVTSRESSPFDVTAADMNEDGFVDLVSADTRSHSVTLLFGDGKGAFVRTPGSLVMVGAIFPRRVLAADFNGDHHLDLVTANETGSMSVLVGDGQGGLAPFPVSPIFEPGFAHSLATGDLDGDGRLDVVTCGPYFGLAVTRNRVLLRNSRWAEWRGSAE